MTAFVIVDIAITDREKFEAYKQQVPASIARYGGKYLARGGRVEVLEGDWRPERLVILEFPTLEQAKAWWASEEYRVPKALRMASSTTRMVAVESV